MRWPLTSTARLEDLRAHYESRLQDHKEHAAYLAAQVERLTDVLVRIKRKESGLGELAPERGKQKEAPFIRADVLALCMAWDQPENQESAKRVALQRFQVCQDWDVVHEELCQRMGIEYTPVVVGGTDG